MMQTERKSGFADFTEGPFLKKIVLYTVPIILTGLLQLLFNAAAHDLRKISCSF